MAQDPRSKYIGQRLRDRWLLQRRIGSGGMAEVLLGDDLDLRVPVAVKILRDPDPTMRRRFAQEARLLAHLIHPQVVRVLGVGDTTDGAPYMVMEYIAGTSLKERLAQGPLPWPEVVTIATQVTEALGHLHGLGIVHRDIKPSNLMLIEVDGLPLIKLIDFGIAALDWERLDRESTAPRSRRWTREGEIMGTYGFVAPEVVKDLEAQPRHDVYALGATLHQLLTGDLPLQDGLERPAVNLPAEVPTGLTTLLRGMLAQAEERLPLRAIREHLEVLGALSDRLPYLLDDYELLELLGHGAHAVAYHAYDRLRGQSVAIKRLIQAASGDPEARRRLAREALILAKITDPALPCCVGGKIHAAAQPYIVLTLGRGRRAADFCLEGHTLTLAAVLAVGRQLAGALRTLHRHGVLHRDINVTNVLIDLDADDRPTATLLDLGMASCTDRFYARVDQRYPTPPEAREPALQEPLQGLAWSAPEVQAGEPCTERSDVYSLALLLFRLFTGKLPYAGESEVMALPSRWVVDEEAPPDLDDVFRAALARDPRRRPDAAGLDELLGELEEQLALMRALATREVEAGSASSSRAKEGAVAPALLRWTSSRYLAPLLVMGLSLGGALALVRCWPDGQVDGLPEWQRTLALSAVPTATMEPIQRDMSESLGRTGDRTGDGPTQRPAEEPGGDAPDLAVASPSLAPPRRQPVDRLPLRLSRREVNAHLARVEEDLGRCFVDAPGRLEARLTIAASGAVESVELDGVSRLLGLCVRRILKALEFPEAEEGSTHRLPLKVQPPTLSPRDE